jgi:hypothetical protein
METKENLLHLFWNCNLIQNVWFVVKNCLMIYGITLPLNAREITLRCRERGVYLSELCSFILIWGYVKGGVLI